jgi:hypothetical protein
MSVELTCPACRAVNAFMPEQAGGMGKCGRCQTPLYVPRPEEMPSAIDIQNRGTLFGRLARWGIAACVVLVLVVGGAGGAFWWFANRLTPEQLQELEANKPFVAAQLVKVVASNSVTQDGTLEDAKSVNVFKFKAPAAGIMAVTMDAAAGSKVEGQLVALNAERKELATNDAVPDKRISQILFPVTADQDYYLKVTGCDAGAGKYKLAFTHLVNVGNAFTSALDVRLSRAGSATQTWRLDPDGDEDVFRVVAPTSGWLAVEITKPADSKLAAVLDAYDGSQARLDSAERFVAIQVEQGKPYFVKVSSLSPPPAGLSRTGAYTIVFRTEKTRPDDYGNDFATAHKVAVTAGVVVVKGRIETEQDVDCFSFQPAKSGKMSVDLIRPPGSSLHGSITVYEGVNRQLNSFPMSTFFDFFVNADTTYHVKLASAQTPDLGLQRTGAYNLQFRLKVMDFNGAKEVVFNASGTAEVAGRIDNADESAIFRFQAPKNGKISLSLLTPAGSMLDAGIYAHDAAKLDIFAAGAGSRFASFFASAGKTYYLRVSPLEFPALGRLKTGAFTVQFKAETADFGGARDVFLSDAGTAVLDGQIANAGSVGVFRLKAPKNGILNLDLINPPGGQLAAGIYMYDAGQLQIGFGNGSRICDFTMVANSTYYFKVVPQMFPTLGQTSTGPYTLKLWMPNVNNNGFNNINKDFQSAQEIVLVAGAATALGEIGFAAKAGFFRVKAPEDGLLVAEVKPAVGSSVAGTIRAYDETKKAVGPGVNRNNRLLDFAVAAGKTYYLQVAGAAYPMNTSGAYVLSLHTEKIAADDYGNDFTSAHEIALTAAGTARIEGKIEAPGDRDFFRIPSSEDGWLNVSVAHTAGSKLDAKLEAYDHAKRKGAFVFPVQAGKDSYVTVASWNPALQGTRVTGRYAVSVKFEKAPPDDFGNDFTTANIIDLPVAGSATRNGRIETPDDVDFFRFKATVSGEVTIMLRPASSGFGGHLFAYDEDKKLIGDADKGLDKTLHVPVQAGKTYYIKVASAGRGSFTELVGGYFLEARRSTGKGPGGNAPNPKN